MGKKAYIGVQEYLESTGGNYLDTKITSILGTKVIMHISIDEMPTNGTSTNWYFFGQNTSGKTRLALRMNQNGTMTILCPTNSAGGASSYSSSITLSINTKYKVEASWNSGSHILKINDSEVASSSISSVNGSSGNLYLFHSAANTGTGKLKVKIYDCQIYQNGALVANFSPSGSGMYDSISNTVRAGNGTFNQGSSKARLIQKMYIGVNGVAKLIKKAYIGVSSKARQFWFYLTELKKSSTTLLLSQSKRLYAGCSFNEKVLISGGGSGTNIYKTVDVYNPNLTKTTAPDLTNAKRMHAAASNSSYALFGGGTDFRIK